MPSPSLSLSFPFHLKILPKSSQGVFLPPPWPHSHLASPDLGPRIRRLQIKQRVWGSVWKRLRVSATLLHVGLCPPPSSSVSPRSFPSGFLVSARKEGDPTCSNVFWYRSFSPCLLSSSHFLFYPFIQLSPYCAPGFLGRTEEKQGGDPCPQGADEWRHRRELMGQEFRGERTRSAPKASWRRALRHGRNFGLGRGRPFSMHVRKNGHVQGKSDASVWGKQNVAVMHGAEQGPPIM